MPSSRARRSRPACLKASTSPSTSTLTSISISMVSASKPLITLILALLSAASLRAQTPTPVRLSFANAVRQATGISPDTVPPVVEIAGFRADAASARVRQARAGLLPSLSLSGSWANRNFNSKAQGISFPGVPTIIGPFNAYDGRVRLTQTLFDFANLGRVSAAKSQSSAAGADRSAVLETSAQTVALAYARTSRSQAVLTARAADSALAAQLVGLAGARPERAAEVARGAAARTSASAISAERLPRIEVEADYGLSGVRAPDAIGTRQVAVQVTLPILDGFRREGRLAEQQAVVREADVRVRDLRQQVSADVDGALLDLRSARAQQMIAAERLQLAAEEISQARARFKAGVAGNIEVINAQVSLLRARDADIDARFAAVSARIALARSVGTARTLH